MGKWGNGEIWNFPNVEMRNSLNGESRKVAKRKMRNFPDGKEFPKFPGDRPNRTGWVFFQVWYKWILPLNKNILFFVVGGSRLIWKKVLFFLSLIVYCWTYICLLNLYLTVEQVFFCWTSIVLLNKYCSVDQRFFCWKSQSGSQVWVETFDPQRNMATHISSNLYWLSYMSVRLCVSVWKLDNYLNFKYHSLIIKLQIL